MKDEELLALVEESFYYSDGHLYNKFSRGRAKKGCKAGSLDKDTGYIRLSLNNKRYQVHRLIFLLHHGYLPEFIDHINNVRDDNRIENLREANAVENSRNIGLRKDSTSGFKGVSYHKHRGKFQAYINSNGTMKYLGLFNTAEEAHEVYKKAAEELFGDFANFG
jgi:hypothetical protein